MAVEYHDVSFLLVLLRNVIGFGFQFAQLLVGSEVIDLVQELLKMEVERLHIRVRLVLHNQLDLLEVSVLLELRLHDLHPLLDLAVPLQDHLRLLLQLLLQVSFFRDVVVLVPRFAAFVSVREIAEVLYFLLVREFEFLVISERVQGPLDHVLRKAFGLLDDALDAPMLLLHIDFRLLRSQVCDTYEVFCLHFLSEGLEVLEHA